MPRFAGSPELIAAASKLAGDPLDQFQEFFANYRARGLSDDAAAALATDALRSGAQLAQSPRFRGVYLGEPIAGDMC